VIIVEQEEERGMWDVGLSVWDEPNQAAGLCDVSGGGGDE
jgi:hypothetical protein